MANCPTCGLSVEEGQRTCPACGGKVPVLIHQKMCKVCGNTLSETAQFCNVCGTPAAAETKAAQEVKEAAKVDERNPTMDEIALPVLDDDTPALQDKPLRNDDTPTMDSVCMPGEKPRAEPIIKPTAEEVAMAQRTVTVGATPTVAATPIISDTMSGGSSEGVLTPEGNRVAPQNIPQNNTYSNFSNSSHEVKPGKGAGALIPLVLILLIIGVVLFDVFYLFKDQIFGGGDTVATCYQALRSLL